MSTNRRNSLRNAYRLDYDRSGFTSGLINWYNVLVDKTTNELNVIDVTKMLRQDILDSVYMS